MRNAAGGGIVDDPAWQRRLTPNMAENLAQSRFNLDSQLATFRRNCPAASFLIAATRRDNAPVSAAVGSSRSAFAYAVSK